MKTKLKLYILAALLFLVAFIQVQGSNYTLSNCMVPYESIQEYDSLYNKILNSSSGVGENTLYNGSTTGSTADSLNGVGFSIGFPFYFDGDYYDRFAVSTNNYLKLGKSTDGSFTIYNEQQKGSVFQEGNNNVRRNTISLFQRTLADDSIKNIYLIRYKLNGTPGNRNLQILWESVRSPGPIGRYVYLRLLEKSEGTILFSYNMDTMKYSKSIYTGIPPDYYTYEYGDFPFMQAAVGLRGNKLTNDTSNLNIMKITKGINASWTDFARGTSPTDLCDMDEHFMPLKVGYGVESEIACQYWYKWTPPALEIQKPWCPYVYFIFTDKGYLDTNGYRYKKIPEDDATGNTYGFINKYDDCYLFANGSKAIPINNDTLRWNKAIGVDSFDVYFGLIYPPVLVKSNTTDTIYTLAENLAPTTTYYYSIVAKNNVGHSNKCNGSFTTSSTPITTCANHDGLESVGSCYDFIFNTLSYTRNAIYYETFYMPESIYTSFVQRGKTYSFAYTDYSGEVMTPYVYIDWNQDGDFTDTGEQFQRSSTSGSTSLGNITIPSNAKLGKTNLRLYFYGAQASGGPNLCGGNDQGNLQQYIITILPSEACTDFVLDYTKTKTKCYGDSTGTITLNPSGGTEPYTYTWTDGNTEKERDSLAVDTYQATVKDAEGCDQTTPVLAIQSPFLIQVDTATVNDSLVVYVTGGTGTYHYTWIKADGTTIEQTVPVLPSAGIYSLTIRDDNYCSVTYTGIVVPEIKTNGLTLIKAASQTLLVYPNPTKGDITVSSTHILNKVVIIDISGKTVYSKTNIAEAKTTLNIGALSTGVYLVKAYTSRGIETNEVIKQ